RFSSIRSSPIWRGAPDRGHRRGLPSCLQKALAPLAHCGLVKTQARCARAVGHPSIHHPDDLRTHRERVSQGATARQVLVRCARVHSEPTELAESPPSRPPLWFIAGETPSGLAIFSRTSDSL